MISERDLSIKRADASRMVNIAECESIVSVEQRKVELEKDLEIKRRETREASLRAEELALATVHAESVTQKAIGEASALEAKAIGEAKAAEAKAIGEAKAAEARALGEAKASEAKAVGEAKALEKMSDAESYSATVKAEGEAAAICKIAEAELYKAEKEAEGLHKKAESQAEQVRMLIGAGNGDAETLKFYLGLETRLPHHIASQTALAVRDMKPHVISMGKDAGEDFAG